MIKINTENGGVLNKMQLKIELFMIKIELINRSSYSNDEILKRIDKTNFFYPIF